MRMGQLNGTYKRKMINRGPALAVDFAKYGFLKCPLVSPLLLFLFISDTVYNLPEMVSNQFTPSDKAVG